MNNHYNTPAETIELNMKACAGKPYIPHGRMILLGIMAGAFIALGAATSSTAAHSITNVGLARLVTGVVFPVGLMLIVFLGGELFTGNCLMVMPALDRRISWRRLAYNLVVVYFSNFAGALIVGALVFGSGNLNYSGGLLGAYAIKVAVGKIAITPVQGITSGILCNFLVCLAVLMATCAKDVTGKIWAVFFPICAFVVGGFEHCVANMFYIPTGIMAASNPAYVQVAKDVYSLTSEQLESLTIFGSLNNFLPVTAGNIIGGMLFAGIPLYMIHRKKQN